MKMPEGSPARPDSSWTKPDLMTACRAYGLKATGSKAVLLARLLARLG